MKMNLRSGLLALFGSIYSINNVSGFVFKAPVQCLRSNTRLSNTSPTMALVPMDPVGTGPLEVVNVKASMIPFVQVMKHYSPFFVTYGLFFAILNKLKSVNFGGGFGKAPGKMIDGSDVTFDDVAGCDYAKRELEEIVDFMKDPAKYEAYGAKLPRGVLFSSQPGMGKTLMAKALATESGVPLIAVSGSEFVSIFVGNGPKRVKEIYDMARKSSPCFVFIDEIDSVAAQRGASIGIGGNDEREATLNQLLTEIDGVNTDSTVITIGATNRPDLLDSALTRPGRMDRRIDMGSLDSNARKDILKVHFKNKPLDSSVDIEALSRQTLGMSGAALANIANEAAIMAARENATAIVDSHITWAFDKLTVGILLPERSIGNKTAETVAYHEAGHALTSYLVGSPDKVTRLSIIPSTSGSAGFTMFTPGEEGESGLHSKSRLEGEILVLLGGRAAEELQFGNTSVTTGAYDDIRRAKALCQNIVDDFGMGGNIAFNEFDSKNKAVEILNESYANVLGLMGENRGILDLVAQELLEEKEILGSRFYEILDKSG